MCVCVCVCGCVCVCVGVGVGVDGWIGRYTQETHNQKTVCYKNTHTHTPELGEFVCVQDLPPLEPLVERSQTENKHPAQRLPFAQCPDR